MNWKIEKLLMGQTIISKEKGNSMLPTISSGQPVKIKPITWDKCEVGDIVYCKVRGNLYTHKVYAKDDQKGVLIGNNNGFKNGWTKTVYGVVTQVL